MTAYLNNAARILEEEIFRSLAYLGEQCVRMVRDRDGLASWFDQTDNLRSSIGYAIFGEGRKVIQSAFEPVMNGALGTQAGQQMIDRLASKFSETYALVVVAGMDYADYVEARDNKDVLASTELWAKSKIDEYLRMAKNRAQTRIAAL